MRSVVHLSATCTESRTSKQVPADASQDRDIRFHGLHAPYANIFLLVAISYTSVRLLSSAAEIMVSESLGNSIPDTDSPPSYEEEQKSIPAKAIPASNTEAAPVPDLPPQLPSDSSATVDAKVRFAVVLRSRAAITLPSPNP